MCVCGCVWVCVHQQCHVFALSGCFFAACVQSFAPRITAFPTFVFYYRGKEEKRMPGADPVKLEMMITAELQVSLGCAPPGRGVPVIAAVTSTLGIMARPEGVAHTEREVCE